MPSKTVKIKNYIDLIPNDFARSVAFSLNGKFLAVGTKNDGVLIYNVKDWKIIVKLPHEYAVNAVEWSPDSKYLATGSIHGPIKIWNSDKWKPSQVLDHSKEALNLAWSPNGKILVAGSWGRFDDCPYLDAWKTFDWSKITTEVHRPRYVSFNPDSSLIAIIYKLEGIEILSAPDFTRNTFLDFSDSDKYVAIYRPSWNNDGSLIAASCGDGRIRIWQTSDWSEVITKQLHDYWDDGEYGVSFSPDGKYLLSGGFGEPKLLSTYNWEVIHHFPKGTLADLFDVSWSPDSKYIALILENGKEIEIWEIRD
ncbi:MAG: hypothetical protein JJE41_16515 [Candidatus Heimdallarchaeota archaeon]|nr:hypothetical protein [Candidatus Heimdallarchaeota archaeon]